VVGEGPPPDAMLRIVSGFDLIAVGTHRRHGPQRWWLGSVAEAIVQHSPRPVLVVPTGVSVPDTRRPPTILVAGGDDAAPMPGSTCSGPHLEAAWCVRWISTNVPRIVSSTQI
jgi:hypothetical protein